MHKSVLVTLANVNFLEQAKQLFSSAYHNSGWNGDFLLLSYDIPEDKLLWFKKYGIEVFQCKPIVQDKIGIWHPSVMSKFHLFTEMVTKWDRVVFLDADVTVEAFLGELGSPESFHAVEDVHHIPVRNQFIERRSVSGDPKKRELITRLERDFDMDLLSFNSGIFSFSTNVIKDDTFQVLVELFREYRTVLRFPEQAILNLYFSGNWSQLPLVYNNYYTRIRRPWRFGTEIFNGICNHFIFEKPWIVKDEYFYSKWKKNLEMSSSIDLGKRKTPARIWTEEEILYKTKMIEKLMVQRPLMTRIGNGVLMSLERAAGLAGKVVENATPTLYERIKRGS